MQYIMSFFRSISCHITLFVYKFIRQAKKGRARSLVVSDLRPETKGSRLESGYYLCAEVSPLQQSPG